MNMELSRRHFLVGASAGLAGTTLGALGFGDTEAKQVHREWGVTAARDLLDGFRQAQTESQDDGEEDDG